MPDQYYPIIQISAPPHMIENMGSRRKFWAPDAGGRPTWLLKFPRAATGEHWAEKVAAEVGGLVGVDVALVQLAEAEGKFATICRSFIPYELYEATDITSNWLHGREFLASAIPDYDVHAIRLNRTHNVKNIVASIIAIAEIQSLDPMRRWMMEHLASYAMLDGLIGNTDRHHENWMVAHEIDADDVWWYVAPSFDHASSLGRELSDERRERILSENGILNYLNKGRGGVFVDSNRQYALPPFRLAQLLCRWNTELGKNWANRLSAVPNAEFRSIIDRIPPEFISETAREFAYQVIVTSKTEILRSIR